VRLLSLLLLGFLPIVSNAHDIVVNWAPPTTWSDGTVMTISQIDFYRLEVGKCYIATDGTTKFGSGVATAYPGRTLTTWTISGIAAGTYCVRMRTKAQGTLSAFTPLAQVTFTGTRAIPSSPSGFGAHGTFVP